MPRPVENLNLADQWISLRVNCIVHRLFHSRRLIGSFNQVAQRHPFSILSKDLSSSPTSKNRCPFSPRHLASDSPVRVKHHCVANCCQLLPTAANSLRRRAVANADYSAKLLVSSPQGGLLRCPSNLTKGGPLDIPEDILIPIYKRLAKG